MASLVYDIAKTNFANGTYIWGGGQAFKVLLAYTTYVPAANHQHVSDVTNEVTGTGYAGGFGGTGRIQLQNLAVTPDLVNHVAQLQASNVSWANINVGGTAVRWAVVFLQVAPNDASSPLVCAVDITGVITNGGNLTIQWAAAGILTIG